MVGSRQGGRVKLDGLVEREIGDAGHFR
jgi:hypothetical protein